MKAYIGKVYVSLIAAYPKGSGTNKGWTKKVSFYEIYVFRCVGFDPYVVQKKKIKLPKMEGLFRLRITKTLAKELIAKGYEVTAAYETHKK